MQKQILLQRLDKIKSSYNKIIEELERTNDSCEKKILLRAENLLNQESASIKEYFDILVEDPCPEPWRGISCSECPKQAQHIKEGIITERNVFFLKKENND
jgi:hypothetical protein